MKDSAADPGAAEEHLHGERLVTPSTPLRPENLESWSLGPATAPGFQNSSFPGGVLVPKIGVDQSHAARISPASG